MSTANFGIWSSLEMHCIAGDFTYADYVETHKSSEVTSALLSEKGYAVLCEVFNIEFKAATEGKEN